MEKLTKKQISVLNLFRKDIFLSKTIREISLSLKKSYPKIYETVNEFDKKRTIKVKKVGGSKVCEINLSQKTISLLSFLDEQEALSRKIPNIEKILEFKEFLDDIMLVTGSFAKKKQTSKSDLDLVIITKSDAFKKQKLFENLTDLFIPPIHAVVFTYDDFIKMLNERDPNFGKEIFKNRLLFRNSTRYYELIKEAINE